MFSVLAFMLLSYFEAILARLSNSAEQIISAVVLVLPRLFGAFFGVFGLIKSESRKWIAITEIVLNGIFTAFMKFVLSFAG